MARPMQTVKICGVQDRRSTKQAKLPWMVRYIIDGRHRSKSFRTRIEAERYRGLLLQAVQDGGRFDDVTGEPESWQTPLPTCMFTSGPGAGCANNGQSGNHELGHRQLRHSPGSSQSQSIRAQNHLTGCASISSRRSHPVPMAATVCSMSGG